jgi:hypothetical protein
VYDRSLSQWLSAALHCNPTPHTAPSEQISVRCGSVTLAFALRHSLNDPELTQTKFSRSAQFPKSPPHWSFHCCTPGVNGAGGAGAGTGPSKVDPSVLPNLIFEKAALAGYWYPLTPLRSCVFATVRPSIVCEASGPYIKRVSL